MTADTNEAKALDAFVSTLEGFLDNCPTGIFVLHAPDGDFVGVHSSVLRVALAQQAGTAPQAQPATVEELIDEWADASGTQFEPTMSAPWVRREDVRQLVRAALAQPAAPQAQIAGAEANVIVRRWVDAARKLLVDGGDIPRLAIAGLATLAESVAEDGLVPAQAAPQAQPSAAATAEALRVFVDALDGKRAANAAGEPGFEFNEMVWANLEAARALLAQPAAPDWLTLQERIAELIREHGTLRAVSRALGLDVGYLSRLEGGDKTNPSDDTLSKLGLQRTEPRFIRAASQPAHGEQP